MVVLDLVTFISPPTQRHTLTVTTSNLELGQYDPCTIVNVEILKLAEKFSVGPRYQVVVTQTNQEI